MGRHAKEEEEERWRQRRKGWERESRRGDRGEMEATGE
jgi:hypothetical protein